MVKTFDINNMTEKKEFTLKVIYLDSFAKDKKINRGKYLNIYSIKAYTNFKFI